MKQTIQMRVTRQDEQFIGTCLDYPVQTHGRTLEELAENMEKALNIFLAGKGPGRVAEETSQDAIVSLDVEINHPSLT